MNPLWDRAIEKGRLYGMRLDGVWMHVGTPEAVERGEDFLADLAPGLSDGRPQCLHHRGEHSLSPRRLARRIDRATDAERDPLALARCDDLSCRRGAPRARFAETFARVLGGAALLPRNSTAGRCR